MNLNLSGQQVEYNTIAPKVQTLKNWMDQRKPIWAKISKEKRKKWVTSDKDPIMSLAWSIYKYLDNNFFGEDFYERD